MHKRILIISNNKQSVIADCFVIYLGVMVFNSTVLFRV